MYSAINPRQFVREHEEDYLYISHDKFYVYSFYAGLIQISESDFKKLQEKGMYVYEN